MKNAFKYIALLLIGVYFCMSSCSKKTTDTTPDSTATPATGSSVCLSGYKTYVLIDASTIAGAASYTKSYACNVTTTQATDTIVLDIKAQSNMDYIYMTLSQDNGPAQALAGTSTLTTQNGKPVTPGTNWTYEIAPGIFNNIPAFILKIPVPVRTSSAAVSDVYTIWITKGKGSFNATGKRTVIGPITVALNYQANTPYIEGDNITIGDQTNSNPSYITTTGIVGVLYGDSLINSNPPLTGDTLARALNSADIDFVRLNAAGLDDDPNTTGNPYFIGVGMRDSLGFNTNSVGTYITKFATLPSGTSFSGLAGSDIAALPNPTNNKILVQQGQSYVFLTQDGRKGVIYVTTLTAGGSSGYSAVVSVKVLTK
jgi:hypothetical protein